MYLYFLFFFVVLIFIQCVFLNKFLNPLFLISFFWFILSSFSYLSITDYNPISDEVFIIVMIFISGLTFGGCGACLKKSYKIENNDAFYCSAIKIFHNLKYLLLLPVLFFCIKACVIFYFVGVDNYRSIVFSTRDNVSILFGNPYVELIYSIFIQPVVFMLFFLGVVLFLSGKGSKVLYFSSMLYVMDSISMMGRFNLYYMLVIIMVSITYSIGINKKLKYKLYKISLVIFFVSIIIGLFRYGDSDENYIITLMNTHVIGLSLFSHELQSLTSLLNKNIMYGLGTFSGLSDLFSMFIRRFDPSYVPDFFRMKDIVSFFVIGRSNTGVDLQANAYYTILYTLYSDGREIGVLFLSMIFGYVLIYNYRCRRNEINFLFFCFFFFFLYFSVFMSPLEMRGVWALFIYMVLFRFYIKLNNRRGNL
ncbi:O-antigen polymerase [Photobacterium phosphoreum]|uniref:O-antigen polymerase n=1 Tax=Photobacterium phosphoreum TaxID=659 RepID=UPI00242E6B5D|nr:O-antigen ligase [Photobacterium phosphoreum]